MHIVSGPDWFGLETWNCCTEGCETYLIPGCHA